MENNKQHEASVNTKIRKTGPSKQCTIQRTYGKPKSNLILIMEAQMSTLWSPPDFFILTFIVPHLVIRQNSNGTLFWKTQELHGENKWDSL